MAFSLRKRMLRGAGAQVIVQGLHTALRLFSVPIFLAFWGAGLYGEWLALAAIPEYLAIGGMGFAGAAARDLAVKVAAGERREAVSVYQTTAILVLLLSIVLALIFVVLAVLLPFRAWLNITAIGETEIAGILAFLAVLIVLGQIDNLGHAGFYGEGRYAEGSLLLSLVLAVEQAALLGAVATGHTPLQAAGAMAVGHAIGTVLLFVALRRTVPWARFGLAGVSIRVARRLFLPAVASMAFPLGRACNHQGIRLVISATLGPSILALFVATRIVTRLIPQSIYPLMRIFQPEMGIAMGEGNDTLLRTLNRRCMQIVIWMGGSSLLLVWLMGDLIMRVWTRDALVFDPVLVMILLIAAFFESVWQSVMIPLLAANRHGRMAVYFLTVNLVALSVAYVLSSHLGLPGAAIALAVTELLLFAMALPGSLVLTGDRFGAWLPAVLPPPLFVWQELRRAASNR